VRLVLVDQRDRLLLSIPLGVDQDLFTVKDRRFLVKVKLLDLTLVLLGYFVNVLLSLLEGLPEFVDANKFLGFLVVFHDSFHHLDCVGYLGFLELWTD
jgi:hypothetical protein